MCVCVCVCVCVYIEREREREIYFILWMLHSTGIYYDTSVNHVSFIGHLCCLFFTITNDATLSIIEHVSMIICKYMSRKDT